MHAQHPQPVVTGCGIGAQPHQGRGDGKAGGIDQFAQQLAGGFARIDHAAAGIEHGAFCLFHGGDQFGDFLHVAFDLGLVVADRHVAFGRIGARCKLHILWQVHQNRAGAAGGGNMECLVQGGGQVVGVAHQPVVFGAGAGDAHGVCLLKGIVADHECGHLTRQNHNRDAVHQGIGQAGHRIGCAGAGCHQRHADLAGRARVSFGGMHRTLFMAHQNVFDIVLLKNLVVNR